MKLSNPLRFKITLLVPLTFLLLAIFRPTNTSWITSFSNDINIAKDGKASLMLDGTSSRSRIQYQWALEPDITARSNSAKASVNESMILPPSKMIMYSGVFQAKNLQHRWWRYQENKDNARYHGLALDFDDKINTGYCSTRVMPEDSSPDVAAARQPALAHSTCPTVKSARNGCVFQLHGRRIENRQKQAGRVRLRTYVDTSRGRLPQDPLALQPSSCNPHLLSFFSALSQPVLRRIEAAEA